MAVLQSPGHRVLTESDRHAHIARDLLGQVPELRGNLTHDFHTAVLMREHGIARIYTRDADFQRFRWVEVIDPLG
jgi:predicted nucleic acid-binding protein